MWAKWNKEFMYHIPWTGRSSPGKQGSSTRNYDLGIQMLSPNISIFLLFPPIKPSFLCWAVWVIFLISQCQLSQLSLLWSPCAAQSPRCWGTTRSCLSMRALLSSNKNISVLAPLFSAQIKTQPCTSYWGENWLYSWQNEQSITERAHRLKWGYFWCSSRVDGGTESL